MHLGVLEIVMIATKPDGGATEHSRLACGRATKYVVGRVISLRTDLDGRKLIFFSYEKEHWEENGCEISLAARDRDGVYWLNRMIMECGG